MNSSQAYRIFLIFLLAFALSACGGSGGDSNKNDPAPTPQLQSQTLTFSQPGPLQLFVGDSFSNPATAPGSGAISYSSSDEQVATVDSEGLVIVHSTGAATITANKQGDSRYTSASATFDVTGKLRANTVTFKSQGTIASNVGESINNPASGFGAGKIHYSSSDAQIATVDEDGSVKTLKWGAATITASQDADSNFSAASASYTLRTAVPMSAWIGEQDTLVSFPAKAQGMSFYRTTQKNCDLANYATCENAALSVLVGQPITDTAATHQRKAFFSLSDGEQQATITVSANQLPTAYGPQMWTLHNNELWLVRDREVWSSVDGVDWRLVTDNVDFSGRHSRQLVSFIGKLWLIGGHAGEGSNILSSIDGKIWIEETPNAAFGSRAGHQVAQLGDRLWLTGGLDEENNVKNDVWSSSDGVNWSLEIGSAAYTSRWGHQMVDHSNKLWIIGGNDPSRTNDIWVSNNGVDWSLVTQDANFPPRSNHKVASYAGKLWLVGGDDGGNYKNDIWSSIDGRTWEQVTDSAAFPARYNQWLTGLDGKLLLISGNDHPDGSPHNDVWSSGNGVTWIKEAPSTDFSTGYSYQLAYYGEKLWLFGRASWKPLNDVRSSDDGGSTWLRAPDSTPFPPALDQRVAVLGSKLWSVITTEDDQHNYHHEIWQSEDGIHWEKTIPVGEIFPARISFELVSHGGKLWLIGGFVNTDPFSYLNDIWSSDDGIHWVKNAENSPFHGRSSLKVVSHNGKLVLLGGYGGSAGPNGGHFYDVWNSVDGTNWDLVTDSAPYTSRREHQAISHNGKLWLIGGIAGDGKYKSDIWESSDNGATWNKTVDAAPFSAKIRHQLAGDGQNLWLMGGYLNLSSGWHNDVWRSEDGVNWRTLHKRQFVFPLFE